MSKEIVLPHIGTVLLTKRKSSKHIRLRVGHNGNTHVSLPFWISYREALKFVNLKIDWIIYQQSKKILNIPMSGQKLGKSHILILKPTISSRVSSKIIDNKAIFYYPSNTDINSDAFTTKIDRLAVRVFKLQSENLLPQRLNHLAKLHNFTYKEVKISKMKSRWGSCNNEKLITLNCYLIQLPWDLIDYVLLHELTHTEVLSHSSKFWEKFISVMPDAKNKRKLIKNYHPHVINHSA